MADLSPPVLLQAFYRREKRGVPSPADGEVAPWSWDHLARQANDFARSGFSAVWLPPVTKGASGTASVGYDVFDDYDLGSKDQKGTIPTRYGTREQLQRCVAMMRANDLDVYVDLPDNQREGGEGPGGFVFRYAGAMGNPGRGRFPKDRFDFHPNVPQDPHVFDGPHEISFGANLAPINGRPARHVFDGLLAAADWLTRTLGIEGYRLDDVKGISTDFLFPLLEHGAMNGRFAVGEFFDGNLALVRNWVSNPNGMRNRASAFDFPRHGLLVQMCNDAGFFDMSHLDHAGLAGVDPFHAVTFVENHDTESTSSLGHITRNKLLAYAYILTSEGFPCVFYKDYSTDRGCLGLKPAIDNLLWIHRVLADGLTQQRWKDHDVFVYERLGGPHLLVGLNNDGAHERRVTVDTGFGPNAELHDYTGHASDVRCDGHGRVMVTIPRNLNGLGYVCYSLHGAGGGVQPQVRSVTQENEGASDVDIPPAEQSRRVEVCRVWAAADSTIAVSLRFDSAGWTDRTKLEVALDAPTGAQLASQSYVAGTAQGTAFTATARHEGFHVFTIQAFDLQVTNATAAYTLAVTYAAPQAAGF